MNEVPRQHPQEESESAKAFKNALELLRGKEGAAETPKAPEPVAMMDTRPTGVNAESDKVKSDALLALQVSELVKAGKLDEAEKVLSERNNLLLGELG